MNDTQERRLVGEAKSSINTALIVVIALSIVAVIMSFLVYSTVNSLQDSQEAKERQEQIDAQRERRTECIRDINNEVNDTRWTAIAHIFEAQGDDAAQAKQTEILLGTVDEAVANRIRNECPPPVNDNETTTTKGG